MHQGWSLGNVAGLEARLNEHAGWVKHRWIDVRLQLEDEVKWEIDGEMERRKYEKKRIQQGTEPDDDRDCEARMGTNPNHPCNVMPPPIISTTPSIEC